MRNHKKLFSLVLALVLALALGVPAFAAAEDAEFSDVSANAWYAEAVTYCQEHGLMSGIGDNQFAPDSSLTRAMLVSALWRQAGSPGVNYLLQFSDVPEGQWYTEGIRWAASERLIVGYGDGRFGTDDLITQEQLNIIFRQYTDKPVTGGIPGFDGSARHATRAQVAAALMNYDRRNQPASDAKILIAYFTVPETSGVDAVAQASRVVENGQVVGNVEFITNTIQEETGGDIFAIETVQTYPGEHQALLDFAAAEMAANARPALSSRISNLDDYDVIFLGYPIWNADLPMPVYTFLDTYDLSGKTVIPFTAHGGSGFAGTISTVAAQEPGAQVERNGFSVSRNSVSAAKNDIVEWVAHLGYTKAAQPAPTPDNSVDVLVAYFSQTGTTQRAARQIAEYTNGDLAEIKRAQPYGNLQDEAKAEIDNGSHPNITVDVGNLYQYDVIFVGYPIWWDEAPAMIATFLAENNFSGKVVAPFCTSSYSPIDNSLHIFRELASGATIADGLTANSESSIRPWVDQVIARAAR